MMNVHMRSAGEIAGKGLHQAKTILLLPYGYRFLPEQTCFRCLVVV